MNKIIVGDTGALISLEVLPNGFKFIKKRYDKIIIPQEVGEEVSRHYQSLAHYLKKYDIESLIETQNIAVNYTIPGIEALDAGEAQAISLACKLKLPLLIEERKGRNIAELAGLEFSGIGGEIALAFYDGVIELEKTLKMLRRLFENGRLNKRIYNFLVNEVATK